jgi:N6-L-threonylcarbamoyladenine synthase
MTDHGKYKLLGRTRDDAAGEAFDKSAKMLSLGYPGGPEISKRAEKGNPRAYDIPRPMIERDDCEFSFSGMKNAIRLLIQDLSTSAIPRVSPISRVSVRNDLSASIEQAIVDILINKSLKATEKHNPKTFILAGGVAANKNLRKSLKKALPKKIKLLIPNIRYCQDNAAMIAATGYFQAKKKKFTKYDTLTAHANWELVE